MRERKDGMRIGVSSFALILTLSAASPATATVHFGADVFVGGHDFSHRTYDRRHRGIVHLYDRPIRHPGCVTRRDGRGGTLQTCRLHRIGH